MKRLALLGAGGHGKVVADAALASGWDIVEFYDDAWPGRTVNGHWPVLGDTAMLVQRAGEYEGVAVSIGNCAIRWERQLILRAAGAKLATIVHPRSWVSPFARLGPGTVVMAGGVINTDAVIGDAGIVNSDATVDHDCMLAHAVHVTPGAHLLGDVVVGAQSWIGVGAVARQGSRIGSNVIVGAGAVVVQDIPDGITVIGNPARPMAKKDKLEKVL
jgi:sugar O-acyltransferase (sialic acid O-acetyltransferase NeuD family)